MDISLFRTCSFIVSFLIIYFIPIFYAAPPRKRNFDPYSILPKQIQKDCFDNIRAVMNINYKTVPEKKEYAQFAVLNLRYLTKKENNDCLGKLENEEHYKYLLYDGIKERYISNKFVYDYYIFMKEKIETTSFVTPEKFCRGGVLSDYLINPEEFRACMSHLNKYGFGTTAFGAFDHAYFRLVMSDFNDEDDGDESTSQHDEIPQEDFSSQWDSSSAWDSSSQWASSSRYTLGSTEFDYDRDFSPVSDFSDNEDVEDDEYVEDDENVEDVEDVEDDEYVGNTLDFSAFSPFSDFSGSPVRLSTPMPIPAEEQTPTDEEMSDYPTKPTNYAKLFLLNIVGNVHTNRNTMKWPWEYCARKYRHYKE